MSISRLFAILIAAAMLFAPFAMPSGSAMAATSPDHRSQMSEEHCEGQPTGDEHGSAADEPCCAALCATSALPTQVPPSEEQFGRLSVLPGTVTFYRGVLSEISTPPPRAS